MTETFGAQHFIVAFQSEEQEKQARVAVESLRTFGGPFAASPVWAFVLDPDRAEEALPDLENVERIPLAVSDEWPAYPFAKKVAVCAEAAPALQVRLARLG